MRWLWSPIWQSTAASPARPRRSPAAGSPRGTDRYVRAVSGSLDAFDQELVGALSRSWFSILRLTARHPVAGWYVDDLLLDRTGLWLMNEALEQSAREGMSLGIRLFEFGGFV